MGFSKECKEMSVHTPLHVMALDNFFLNVSWESRPQG